MFNPLFIGDILIYDDYCMICSSSQKWDLVKLVVSQPFNKQTQFGLTFAKFTTPPDPDAPVKIGAFTLKKPLNTSDDDLLEDEEPVRIGAMFAKSLANKSGKSQSLFIFGQSLIGQINRQNKGSSLL